MVDVGFSSETEKKSSSSKEFREILNLMEWYFTSFHVTSEDGKEVYIIERLRSQEVAHLHEQLPFSHYSVVRVEPQDQFNYYFRVVCARDPNPVEKLVIRLSSFVRRTWHRK